MFFYGSLYLIVLLFAGTVEQKTVGLYRARMKYFSAAFFSFFGVPLPSARAVLALICLSLLLKIFFYTKNLQKNGGALVMHAGALLLLASGFLSSKLSQEGYVLVREGEASRSVIDYYNAELALTDEDSGRTVVFPQTALVRSYRKARPLLPPGAGEGSASNDKAPAGGAASSDVGRLTKAAPPPAKKGPLFPPVRIKEFFQNAERAAGEASRTAPASLCASSKELHLKPKPPSIEREQDRAGLIFSFFEEGREKACLLLEGEAEIFSRQGRSYRAELRPEEKTRLPFSLHLIDFQRELYPGTDKPRSFLSLVEIRGGGAAEKRAIKMNRPLRRGDWTFYQSSFQEGKAEGEKDLAVFAAVENRARSAPYLASLILGLGALIPLFRKRKNGA